MKEPGFVTSLREELKHVNAAWQARIHRLGGLSDEELIELTTQVACDPAMAFPDHPDVHHITPWSDVTEEDELEGEQAINDGRVAFAVLAGGAGTRFGGPKFMETIPDVGLSMLGWKLLQAGNMPVWVMTSPAMLAGVERHISSLAIPLGMNGAIFEQFEGYRLTPDNRLSQIIDGLIPDTYPLGHGDLGPALVEAGVLDDNPDVKYVVVSNVDNVLGSPHAGMVGHHIRSLKEVTCEVVERQKDDAGGVLAWVMNELQVVDNFRLPEGFTDASPVTNTNNMIINVDVLKKPIPWRWHRVRKLVDSKLVIQYERLIQQYTEVYPANYVIVPRDSRYCPVKTVDDLEVAGKVLAGYRYV